MQSRLSSLIESFTNIAIGLLINTTAQHVLFPLWDIHISVSENLQIAMAFTVISLIRSYTIRRWFNKKT